MAIDVEFSLSLNLIFLYVHIQVKCDTIWLTLKLITKYYWKSAETPLFRNI